MSEPLAAVLLTASPGPLRDAMRALLLSMPQIKSVAVAGHPEGAMQAIAESLPRMVVVIAERLPGWETLPQRIRAAAPACRITVLADEEVEANTADLLLQQGARPETIIAALLALLNEPKEPTDGGQNG